MIINLISGPRNISTAMMYAFAQRQDTKVVDEPFYAYYLNHTQLDHPGREEILASMPINPEEILNQIHQLNKSHEVVFLKNMAHHHLGLDWNYLKEMKNIFLIRNPHQLIASFARVIEEPTLQDIGLKEEAELFECVKNNGVKKPIVVDANDILSNPEKGLNALCQQLGINFNTHMLNWKKEPIPEDGCWAKYWYKNVHNSSGFTKQKTSERPFPTHCTPLLEEAMPYYKKLKSFASPLEGSQRMS